MRAGMYFERNPGVHLSILVKNSFATDQAGRVKDVAGPARINLKHRAALNVNVVLAGFLLQTFGVLVWDFDCQFLNQLLSRFKNWRRMGDLRNDDEPYGQKRPRARDR